MIGQRIKKDAKRQDPNGDTSILSSVPRALPAMMKAMLLGTRASRVGFDWERASDVVAKVDEEMEELRVAVTAGDRDAA